MDQEELIDKICESMTESAILEAIQEACEPRELAEILTDLYTEQELTEMIKQEG